MRTVPQFELVDVGIEVDTASIANEKEKRQLSDKAGNGKARAFSPEKLWRRYMLKMDGFECDILEVFPDRRIFTMGAGWLDSNHTRVKPIPPRLIIEDTDGKVSDTVVITCTEDQVTCADDASWKDSFGGRMRLLVAFLAVLYFLIRGETNLYPSGWSYVAETFSEGSS